MDNILPYLTKDFIDYFSKQKLQDKLLIELGSGDSTLYWEKKFKKVISYESNGFYADDLRKKIKRKVTELYTYDPTLNKIFLSERKLIDNFAKADYIIIDNKPNEGISRYDFSVCAVKYKKESCSIILDNGNWNIEAYNYLRERFFVKDFPGICRIENTPTVTSVFSTSKLNYYNY